MIYEIIVQVVQGGKTRIVKNKISTNIQECNSKSIHCINLYLSANNRMLTGQTSSRMEKKEDIVTDDNEDIKKMLDLAKDFTNKNANIIPYAWMSGVKKNTKLGGNKDADDLAGYIFGKGINTILACTNTLRINRIKQLIEELECYSVNIGKKYKIFIWVDEADLTLNYWDSFLRESNVNSIEKVTFVTATLGEKLIKAYPTSTLVPIVNGVPRCYRGADRVNFVTCDELINLEGIKNVVEKNNLNINGSKIFIPSYYITKFHDDVCRLLTDLGFAVILLNGKKKHIIYPNGDIEDLSKYFKLDNPPFEQVLCKIYYDSKLYEYPLAITGHDLLSCGVTFMSESFVWTSAIFIQMTMKNCSSIHSRSYEDTILQIAGRVFGNIGDYTSRQIDIYTTSDMIDVIKSGEQKTKFFVTHSVISKNTNIVDIYEKWRVEHQPKTFSVSKQTKTRFEREFQIVKYDYKIFETYEEAKKHCRILFPDRRGPNKKQINNMGFYECTIRDTKVHSTEEINREKYWGINKDNVFRLHVGYRDLDDKGSIEWWLVYYIEN